MYEFWYDYAKPKYDRVAKPCYLGTDSFIIYIKNIIFTKILQKTLKQSLILQIMSQKNRYQKEITKRLLKTEFVG